MLGLGSAPPPGAPGVTAPPAPPPTKEASFGELDLDLPAPKHAPRTKEPTYSDLPAPKSTGLSDLPTLKANVSRPPRGLSDLPAPKVAKAPSPSAPQPASGSRELELDDLPVLKSGDFEDLPALKDPHADLPAPKSPGLVDLPTPKVPVSAKSLPARPVNTAPPASMGGSGPISEPLADLDLLELEPTGSTPARPFSEPPEVDGSDNPVDALPTLSSFPPPAGEEDFNDHTEPTSFPALSNTPVPGLGAGSSGKKPGGVFGDLELPQSKERDSGKAPAAAKITFDELSLPTPKTSVAPASAKPMGSTFGDLELPIPTVSMPGTPKPTSDQPKAGAGTASFGELDLDGGPSLEIDQPKPRVSGEEFRDIPESSALKSSIPPVEAPVLPAKGRRSRVSVEDVHKRPVGKSRLPLVLSAAVALIVLAGIGAGFVTPYGFFGAYYLEQFLPAAGNPAEVAAAIKKAEQEAKSDTYSDVRVSLKTLATARNKAGLNRELLARSLMHESLYVVRFGEDASSVGRGATIMQRLLSRSDTSPNLALAQAAFALHDDKLSESKSFLVQAQRSLRNDPYVDLVAGEIALREKTPEDALRAFQAAHQKGAGARASWGIVRALRDLNKPAELAQVVEQTLTESPFHVEARLERARLATDQVTAIRLAKEAAGLESVNGQILVASKTQRSLAYTLLGDFYEKSGRRREAIDAYGKATNLDAYNVEALLGAGRSLLGQTQYREALARFEAVPSVQTSDEVLASGRTAKVEAKILAGRALIALDRAQDAKSSLLELSRERANDSEVLLWLGHAEEELSERAAAEQHYREAIRLAPTRFEPYLALAESLYATGHVDLGDQLLADAEKKVPETADVRAQRGQAKLSRNDIASALTEFRRALVLDPSHVGARFGLGAASRRIGNFNDAAAAFEHVAASDPDYPGLAMERGMVFEAQGKSAEAVVSYTNALKERPGDLDLELRLGAALVGAGRVDEAEAILNKVQAERPHSAEVEHFVGRIAFARNDYTSASQHFNRAVDLDSTRGEFYMYAGWAFLELGSLGPALESIENAVQRDPSLGDAFWLRGRIRVRMGALREAVTDLTKALELKPGRYEAYADMAQAYDELGRRADAVQAYGQALARDSQRGDWWFNQGRLELDLERSAEAVHSLERATAVGDASGSRAPWVSDSHRVLGEALRLRGDRAGALREYRKYMELAPPAAIDRDQIARQIQELESR